GGWVKYCWWGRRRDAHTLSGGLNPASRLQWPRRSFPPFRPVRYQATLRRPQRTAPLSMNLQVSMRQVLRNRREVDGQLEDTFQCLSCYSNPSLSSARHVSFFNDYARCL